MALNPNVRSLGLDDVGLIAGIDRSERIEVEFTVRNSQLVQRPVSMIDVPAWDLVGEGPHSVAAQVGFCEPLVARGAAFLGAFDGGDLLGVALVDTSFEPSAAWLAFLYVSRPYRRRGVASALWEAAVVGSGGGTRSIHVCLGYTNRLGCRVLPESWV